MDNIEKRSAIAKYLEDWTSDDVDAAEFIEEMLSGTAPNLVEWSTDQLDGFMAAHDIPGDYTDQNYPERRDDTRAPIFSWIEPEITKPWLDAKKTVDGMFTIYHNDIHTKNDLYDVMTEALPAEFTRIKVQQVMSTFFAVAGPMSMIQFAQVILPGTKEQ